MRCTSDVSPEPYPPQDHLACGLSVCLSSSWSAVQIHVLQNLIYELTAGQSGTGSAWKLYKSAAQRPLWSPVPGLLWACTQERQKG